ncbi:MAG TPA: SMI1/KNR4 family protein [Tepidisphaeraceae bacterium]|jgi:hypothetical protein|nr:SMI1/KNR4 family protein [Tepidisphaeraceae bacterium]
MSIQDLCAVLKPPAHPTDVGSSKLWAEAEAELGAELPSDYKQFISIYGSGSIDDFLTPFNACSHDPIMRLFIRGSEVLEAHRSTRRLFPDEFDWPLFPEPGGWLPWGTTPNVNSLFWVTDGPPDEWTIVVAEGHAPYIEHYDESFTSFLSGVISRRITCDLLGSHFPREGGSEFVP